MGGQPPPGDVEGRAVDRAHPQVGQTGQDRQARVRGQQLDRDEALVVVERQNPVVAARGGLGEDEKLIDGAFIGMHALTFIGLMFAWRHLYDLASRADGPDAALTLRRLWKRYFHVLLLVGIVALAVNVYELADVRRWIGTELWLAPATLVLLAAVFTWLWYGTWRANRALARVLQGLPVVER